jgi:hypothetical protein
MGCPGRGAGYMLPPDLMTDALSFSLPVTSVPSARGVRRGTTRLEGLLRLSESGLVIEWSGSMEVVRVRGPEVQTRVESVPATRREIPFGRLADVAVRGWWRPWLDIRTADLEALDGVPSAASGRVSLRLRRADRLAAQHFAVEVRDGMADAALQAAEGE